MLPALNGTVPGGAAVLLGSPTSSNGGVAEQGGLGGEVEIFTTAQKYGKGADAAPGGTAYITGNPGCIMVFW